MVYAGHSRPFLAHEECLIRVLAVVTPIPVGGGGKTDPAASLSLSLEPKAKTDGRTQLGRQMPPALGVVEVGGSVAANGEGFLLGVA